MPYLIAVDGHRHSLRRGHTYVIGRGRDCDIVLDDGACSRQHIRVSVARSTDAAFLEDLGSRNGTYLNGELVRRRLALREGSRVQLGASIFLVRLKEEPEEVDLAETGTATYDLDGQRHDVDGGTLAECGAMELVRMLFNARRSVTVHIAVPKAHAILEFRTGECVYADFSGLEGFNALVKLARQTEGIFWLVETTEECERNLTEPTLRVMSELQRCIDPAAGARHP